ncbi:MAG: DNA adenine methylase [Candidatus Adlerbacteria bacterium]|nr:DNA adenine methylase [Candidatus Adlerbacteria bacterium]
MGSKIKLLDRIAPILERMVSKGDKILDLMAGTHSIGYALKPNHPIIGNDVQEYSKVIGIARIENNKVRLSAEDLERDIYPHLSKNKTYKLFQKYYTDTYFTKEQCVEIDNVRFAIDKVKDTKKKAIYLTALIYAMGHCQSSPGHFAQYMPKDHPRLKTLRKLSILDAFTKKLLENHILFSNFQNKVVSMDYRNLFTDKNIKKYLRGVKLVYIDPPYSPAQYSRFYHLLETAVKYDYPKLSHKGLYRQDRFQSDFCYPSKVSGEFDFIVSHASNIGAKVAISYSESGLITSTELKAICKKYFKKVRVYYFKHSHSMQGRGTIKNIREVLVTGEN